MALRAPSYPRRVRGNARRGFFNDSTDGPQMRAVSCRRGRYTRDTSWGSKMRYRRQFRAGRSPFDSIMNVADDGTEWWSAREMMEPMGYFRWEGMEAVLGRAITACQNSGQAPADHFRQTPKLVQF